MSDESAEQVEQTFALARSGYSQVMLMLNKVQGDEPCTVDLSIRMGIVKESLQHCTELWQGLFKVEAAKLTPQATVLLGTMAALVKGYYDSQWQSQVVRPQLSSQTDETSLGMHRELAEVRIKQCLEEVLAVVKSDERAGEPLKNCLGILAQLLQMHCMLDGLVLAETHADYRALFFRDYYPRMLSFSPQMVSFVLILLNRVTEVLPKVD
jgi:hypothetical protein